MRGRPTWHRRDDGGQTGHPRDQDASGGLGADSEEKREPASDIDTAAVDGLKALDPDRPIREADITDAFKT
jgi:hypothetical protein